MPNLHARPLVGPTVFLLLASFPVLAESGADPVVDVLCPTSQGEVRATFFAGGGGEVAVSDASGGSVCPATIKDVEGPPFSERVGGMLALEIYRSACAPRDLDGQLLGEIFIHVYDQETPEPTAKAMIWRGQPPESCRVAALSLEGLGEVEDEASH